MSREKNLAINTIILSIGSFLPKICGLITLPMITASLTKTEYGIYDLINTFIALLILILSLQIQTATFRFLIEYRDDRKKIKEIISSCLSFIFVISVISSSLLFLILSNVDILLKSILCFYLFSEMFFMSFQQIIRGLSLNKIYSFTAVLVSIINTILIILTVSYLNYALLGVLISTLIATVISIIFLLSASNILKEFSFKCISLSLLKKMISYSLPMIPNSLSGWILSLSDRLIITFFLGIETTAIYTVANKIPNLFTALQGTVVLAWQENASLYKDDDDINVY